MALPLLLAGPILRRVDPNLVSVWLALSEPAKVSLVVYEGVATAANATPFVTSAPEDTWRLGDKLHLALVSARIPETAGKSLQPDTLYSYDLSIIAGGRPHDLASLNMLRDATASESPDGHAHLALGYQPDVLPSFAPCPSKLPDLRILYGSCRLPSCPRPRRPRLRRRLHRRPRAGPALAPAPAGPRRRPGVRRRRRHADDDRPDRARQRADRPGRTRAMRRRSTPVEHIFVNKVMKRTDAGRRHRRHRPRQGVPVYAEDTSIAPADRLLPADAATFPPGRRLELTKRAAAAHQPATAPTT